MTTRQKQPSPTVSPGAHSPAFCVENHVPFIMSESVMDADSTKFTRPSPENHPEAEVRSGTRSRLSVWPWMAQVPLPPYPSPASAAVNE